MEYKLNQSGSISIFVGENSVLTLPPEDNGTPEWDTYKKWLEEGNEPLPPDPTPEPEPLTAQQKLEAAGLTIEELKGLLGI